MRIRVLIATVIAASLAALAACGGDKGEHAKAESAEAGQVLSRRPYMGVACHVPNSIECDRVGLAVWLKDPAVRVDAAIDGRELKLDDPQWSEDAHDGKRRMFAGFLQPAGLIDGPLQVKPDAGAYYWIGTEPVSGTVDLRIERANGTEETTTTKVALSPGWG